MPAEPARIGTRRPRHGEGDESSRARQRAEALFEVGERRRRPRRVPAHDRGRGPDRRRHDDVAAARAYDAIHALTEADEMRDAGAARAEEDDDAFVGGECGGADKDAAKSPEAAAGHEELHGGPEIAF